MLNRGDRHKVHEGLSSHPNTHSYSHTTLISRPIALNSGSPVYTSTFSRFASAAAKQSATAGLNVTVFATRSAETRLPLSPGKRVWKIGYAASSHLRPRRDS